MGDAIGYMQSQHMLLSVLHAADWVQPLYSGLGWRPVPMRWAVLQVTAKQAGSSVRELVLNEHTDVKELADLHNRYAQRFEGSTVRSCEYWQRWVQVHIESADQERLFTIGDENGVHGLVVLQYRAHREALWKVKDFAVCDAQFAQDGGASVFHTLAGHALATSTMHMSTMHTPGNIACGDTVPACSDTVPVRIPAAAANCFTAGGAVEEVGADCGWMYRQLNKGTADTSSITEGRHLNWPMDSF
jgi:hypothetical protein